MQQNVNLKQRLIKGAAGSFGLKVVATGLGFLLNLLLARTLGSEGLGTYALCITWLALLALPAKLGFPEMMLRDIAIYSSQANWSLFRGLLTRAYQIVLSLSVAIAFIIMSLGWLWVRDIQTYLTLSITLISLPFYSLRSLNQSVMHGLNKIVQGQLPESLIAPMLVLLLTLASYVIVNQEMTPRLVLAFYAISAAISVLIGGFQVINALPGVLKTVEVNYETWHWVRNSLPFMVFGALHMVNSQTDIVMLGGIGGARSVGLYVVANKLSSLILFILVANNSVLGPNIASLYAAGKRDYLERLIVRSSRIVLLFSCVLAIFIFLFKMPLLEIFGREFFDSYRVLNILIIGQLINAFSGPVGLLLNMSGNEKLSLVSFALSAITNVSMNFYLIPKFGAEGAAISTATSMIIWNLLGIFMVIKYLRINPTALGRLNT